jgi:malonate decarboxylase alpha subunit
MCRDDAERQAAIRAVAGYTPVGLKASRHETEALHGRGVIVRPDDLGISPRDASRSLLAAADIKDLVRWSGGLYDPPSQFVDW